ncbi:GNAT family N-acetyltransferase [Shewanella cyperi]|uniref:GNAT family N-acetyltransferase n=1 Tax=Shewanella cyperi TaxID=2814292 RepID=A0A974XKS1_9GAMM|nr:GNAT family N-acetyltransferase [Shewanella cyperi]QSX29053.1 GNAT family N-acetyltransferase [Shewanella cyperi]
MTLDILEDESSTFADEMKARIAAFNAQHWDASARKPLGLKLLDADGSLLGGISGRTFGNWCHIEYLWVSEAGRGQGLGSRLLSRAEELARARGCHSVLLDTLEFQARDFYQRHGYRTVWVQQQYPFSGEKYFMVKQLDMVKQLGQ